MTICNLPTEINFSDTAQVGIVLLRARETRTHFCSIKGWSSTGDQSAEYGLIGDLLPTKVASKHQSGKPDEAREKLPPLMLSILSLGSRPNAKSLLIRSGGLFD